MPGVLAHVGRTRGGKWVLTHQVADELWQFKSFVQISTDGEAWSAPVSIQPQSDNAHDAFPIRRQDEGSDLYYLRPGPAGELNVLRRMLGEDGSLGVEQAVTDATIGHVEKPQARRLPDGRLVLMFARRSSATDYDIMLGLLDGDSPSQ